MTKIIKSSGVIYTVTNNKTDKVVYVGLTKKSLNSRKKDHIQRAKRGDVNLFQEAIATLGVESFTWTTDNTLYENDELAQKEQELIENYKKQGVKLFNKDRSRCPELSIRERYFCSFPVFSFYFIKLLIVRMPD